MQLTSVILVYPCLSPSTPLLVGCFHPLTTHRLALPVRGRTKRHACCVSPRIQPFADKLVPFARVSDLIAGSQPPHRSSPFPDVNSIAPACVPFVAAQPVRASSYSWTLPSQLLRATISKGPCMRVLSSPLAPAC